MRKITRKVTEAFLAGKSFSSGNTMTDGHSIYLHGNRIVSRLGGGNIIIASSAGWRTPTTRDRINGVIWLLQERGEKTRPFISFSKDSDDLKSEWERLNYINSEVQQ